MHKISLTLVVLSLFALSSPTFASDHLKDAVDATGGNPVGGNPSGVSGGASDPGTVPGEGNPNNSGIKGEDGEGTPAADLGLVDSRKGRGASD